MPENVHVVYHELIEQLDDVFTVLELVIDEMRIEEAKLDAAIDAAVSRDRRWRLWAGKNRVTDSPAP